MRFLLAALLGSLAAPRPAAADRMDLALWRLTDPATDVATGDCYQGDPEIPATLRDVCANNRLWSQLMSEMGMALAPPILSPARTVGPRGFSMAVETWITGISSDSEYWQRGTEGARADAAEGRNRFPSTALMWTRVAARKGFPLGFELGTSVGQLLNTNTWTLGLELKWALFEGFRTGLGVLPDVAVRGTVNTIAGDPEYNLTVPAVDLVVSKPLVVSGIFTVTPFVSGQMIWIVADSELVDLTPSVDAFAECRPDPALGSTTCKVSDGGGDYNNNTVFDSLRYQRTRLAVGAQARYENFVLSASFQVEPSVPAEPTGLTRRWTAAASAGLQY